MSSPVKELPFRVDSSLHKYKYKIVRESFPNPSEFVKKMNKLGYHGWKIIDIDRDETGTVVEVILAKALRVKLE